MKYYADGENGLSLNLDLDIVRKEYNLPPFKGEKPKSNSSAESAAENKSRKNRKGRKYTCLFNKQIIPSIVSHTQHTQRTQSSVHQHCGSASEQ